MFGFEFANPKYFLLLILLVPMIVWYILKEKKSHADLQFSSLQAFKGIKHSGRIWWRHVLFVLELLAIILLVTALARPQSSNSWQTYTSEGIDIALALDVSTSMLARDFTPDRLEAAKENMPVEIDEGVLQQIANVTGGKYFRATDNDKLQQIYSEIDQLEKSKIEVKHFSKKNEQYFIFGLLGMCLLIAQAVLKYTLLRKIP